jgi:hypothetical protein
MTQGESKTVAKYKQRFRQKVLTRMENSPTLRTRQEKGGCNPQSEAHNQTPNKACRHIQKLGDSLQGNRRQISWANEFEKTYDKFGV